MCSLILLSCKSSRVTTTNAVYNAQKTNNQSYDFRIMTYNVENLFDTKHDEGKKDTDFLPWGMYNWTQERYNIKLKRIFKVITNISEWQYPGLIALTEIENQAVLEDLIHGTPLAESDYNIIHEESPDERGIDVALLYRRSLFRPISHEIIPVTIANEPHFKTRDILYVKGIINQKDTLHFFVLHFPSRRGGEAESEYKRVRAATLLRAKADSILKAQPLADIIITGDFNDDPTNASAYEVLRGKSPTKDSIQPGDFYNLMYDAYQNGYGSYKFQNVWNMLDQYIVSQSLLDKSGDVYTTASSAHIFSPDWLSMRDDRYPGLKPNRTYSGPTYQGGYSDHYPVYMDLYFKKSK